MSYYQEFLDFKINYDLEKDEQVIEAKKYNYFKPENFTENNFQEIIDDVYHEKIEK